MENINSRLIRGTKLDLMAIHFHGLNSEYHPKLKYSTGYTTQAVLVRLPTWKQRIGHAILIHLLCSQPPNCAREPLTTCNVEPYLRLWTPALAQVTYSFTAFFKIEVTLLTPQGRATKEKQGCPLSQGSCSGPALWNLAANKILNQVWPDNVRIQAFSDDFVLVIKADTNKSLVEDKVQ
ncbi:hypothetical protein AVEN_267136-1 [Araneus ventricosus]|uniref:Reverse transcriptase domain-containing protein n=1 Tax=Araneus ventricosus TaxID=182803 RepID=A0A4Y2GFE7_ARAVE|nr:hypothetical protein AVEN_267136-1 [Araneus ventricosus]